MTTNQPPPAASRASITEDQVFAVAQALSDAGVRPTSAKIREKLGKGSATTIQAMLERWRERRASAAPAPIPADLVDQSTKHGAEAAQSLLHALWGPIRDQVAREYDARLKEQQLRAQEYHDDLQEATESVVSLELKIAEATSHNDTLAGLNGDLTATVRSLEQQNRDLASAVKESTTASQKASEEASIQTKRANDSDAQLAATVALVDSLKRESAQKGADLMRLREEHQTLQHTSAALASDQLRRIEKLAGEASASQVVTARLQEQLAAAAKREEELGPIVSEFGILRRRNEDLTRRIALLTGDNPKVTGFLALLRKHTVVTQQKTVEDMLVSQLPSLPAHHDVASMIPADALRDVDLDTFSAEPVTLTHTHARVPFRFSFVVRRSASPHVGRRVSGSGVLLVDDYGLALFSDIEASWVVK